VDGSHRRRGSKLLEKLNAEVIASKGQYARGHLVSITPNEKRSVRAIQLFPLGLLRETCKATVPSVEPGLVRCCSLSAVLLCCCLAAASIALPPTGVSFARPKSRRLAWPRFGDKYIGRLDVAVSDPFGVGSIERVSNLDGERKNQLGLHWTPGDGVLQRHAVQKLHGDGRLRRAGRQFRKSCRCSDGFRAEAAWASRLEASQRLRVSGYFIGKKLQGDKSVQGYVLGFVDNAHAPATELIDDAKMRNCAADERLGFWHGSAHLRMRSRPSQPQAHRENFAVRARAKSAMMTIQPSTNDF